MKPIRLPGAAGAKDTLSRAHNNRNKSDYEGLGFDLTNGMVDDLVDAALSVKEEVDFNYKKFNAAHKLKIKAAENAQASSAAATQVEGKKPT